jgi:hypothetical protein
VIFVFFFGAGLASCAAEVHIFQAVFHAVVLLSPGRRALAEHIIFIQVC